MVFHILNIQYAYKFFLNKKIVKKIVNLINL